MGRTPFTAPRGSGSPSSRSRALPASRSCSDGRCHGWSRRRGPGRTRRGASAAAHARSVVEELDDTVSYGSMQHPEQDLGRGTTSVPRNRDAIASRAGERKLASNRPCDSRARGGARTRAVSASVADSVVTQEPRAAPRCASSREQCRDEPRTVRSRGPGEHASADAALAGTSSRGSSRERSPRRPAFALIEEDEHPAGAAVVNRGICPRSKRVRDRPSLHVRRNGAHRSRAESKHNAVGT